MNGLLALMRVYRNVPALVVRPSAYKVAVGRQIQGEDQERVAGFSAVACLSFLPN